MKPSIKMLVLPGALLGVLCLASARKARDEPITASPVGSAPSHQLPSVVSKVHVDVKEDCGARGDGVSDDTIAFQKAAQLIQQHGGGTLNIPEGTYIVGGQSHQDGQYPYYRRAAIFEVNNLNGLYVDGHNATIRLASGLHFGSFDKDTGRVFNPPMPFYDRNCAVQLGNILSVIGSSNVVIANLELDGNAANVVLGGTWGDTGRQLPANGLYLYNDRDVQVDRVSSHHNALDGAIVGFTGLKQSDPPTPVTLRDCSFEYNARQGLSWVGGRGLKVYRCKFDHTGRTQNNGAVLSSAPGAGVDIEAEDAVVRDGYFEGCQYVDNIGAGMVADSGDGGYSTFKDCTFWGTTNWSMWSRKPGLKYENCKIYGSAVHAVGSPDAALATSWTGCTFEDRPWTNGEVFRGHSTGSLFEVNGNLQNVDLKNCSFIAHTCKSIWANADPAGRIAIDGCHFVFKNADLPDHDFQALFRNANFTGCSFTENFAPEVTRQWYIESSNPAIAADPPTVVDGPRVKWLNWSWGKTGALSAVAP